MTFYSCTIEILLQDLIISLGGGICTHGTSLALPLFIGVRVSGRENVWSWDFASILFHVIGYWHYPDYNRIITRPTSITRNCLTSEARELTPVGRVAQPFVLHIWYVCLSVLFLLAIV